MAVEKKESVLFSVMNGKEKIYWERKDHKTSRRKSIAI